MWVAPRQVMDPASLLVRFRDVTFWKRVNPALAIDGPPPRPITTALPSGLRARALRDRAFTVGGVLPEALVAALATAVHRLHAVGCPPVFLFVHDEPWEVAARVAPIAEEILGGPCALLPELWVWRAEPEVDDAPAETAAPRPPRTPRWLIADEAPRSLTLCLPLAGPGGAALHGWLHDVPRWGGRADHRLELRRTSLTLAFQRADRPAYRAPLLDPRHPPAFNARLALVGNQVLEARLAHGVPARLVELARGLQAPTE